MTNLDSQATADFWDAYITAAEAGNEVPMPTPTASDENVGDDDHVRSQ